MIRCSGSALCSPVPMFPEHMILGTYVPRFTANMLDVVIGIGIPSELFNTYFRFVNGMAYTAETQTHKYTDTQTHRHTDTLIHRHTDTHTHRHTNTHTHTHTQTHIHTHTHTNQHNHVTFLNLYIDIDLILWATINISIPEVCVKVIQGVTMWIMGWIIHVRS